MKVIVITAGSGGGHRATSRALVAACASLPWTFVLVDYTEVLGTPTRWGDHFYNWLMATGRMRWMTWMHAVAHVATWLTRPLATALFRRYFRAEAPDLVVSCCPVINGLVADALDGSAPLVTLLSDFESSSEHPWIQDPRQYMICGTQRAVEQALASGHPSSHIFQTSGMLVHPSFYAPRPVPMDDLDPSLRTVCVCFGGVPPPTLALVVDQLLHMDEPVNILVIGSDTPQGERVYAVGFVENVADYMSMADVVVGKPGPGVVSEALVLGIPVVVLDHPDHTPPQERSVAAWVQEHGVGVVIKSLDELEGALAPTRLGVCARHHNTAYVEILEILTMVASR